MAAARDLLGRMFGRERLTPECDVLHRTSSRNASVRCYPSLMASSRTTFTLDEELAAHARRLGVNISAAARQGVAAAVRAALAQSDREAYLRHPEGADTLWAEAETWGEP
jgi:post-segregation antitoxin (ccd killing protein)